MGINVLSCFDGMSSGQLALREVGIEVDNYYASEIDKAAIAVTMKNFPNTQQVGDITTLDISKLPKIDLVIGGSPCQGFSFAGKQLNFEDPRSKLFFEFVRLYKEAKAINPKLYFLLENVKMKKEYQDVISEYLGVQPIQINSALVSAQNRIRLYWTNIPDVHQPNDEGILLQHILENGVVDRDKSYCIDANYWKGGDLNQYFNKSRRQLVFNDFAALHQAKHHDLDDKSLYRKLTPVECERLQTIFSNYTLGVSNSQRYKMLGNGWTLSVIEHLFKNLLLCL